MAHPDGIVQDLWDAATKRLSDAEKAQLAKKAVDNNTLSQQLLELVLAKQQQCTERRWKFKRSNGEVIVIRDLFEKTIRWLQKFKEVVDVGT
ncbi:ankyrin repeat protein [Colletotrichum tofieldiae]|nr:ankyrin repeat protein [Colletotrichum tofieldiae]GKT77389.1 ankyrin repeat protein [Colletotrichum tofieldiae]GKT86210.1 ankyrin repeat protein [Colletotrichum tofieldiae]